MLRTTRWERRIDRLDPEADASEIVSILFNHVFPLDHLAMATVSQFTTFTIPRISKLLNQTGQYRAGGKRIDDTLAIGMALYGGLDTPEGRDAVAHLNRIHGFYDIHNDDNVYTLVGIVTDLVGWIERFGWRALRPRERDAVMVYYGRLARGMRVEGMPTTYDAALAWRRDYERDHQRYHANNEAVARAAIDGARELVPDALGPLVEPFVATLLDRGAREALGLSRPNAALRGLITLTLRSRARLGRFVNPYERRPFGASPLATQRASYPNGYAITDVGPEKILAALAKQAGCPAASRANLRDQP